MFRRIGGRLLCATGGAKAAQSTTHQPHAVDEPAPGHLPPVQWTDPTADSAISRKIKSPDEEEKWWPVDNVWESQDEKKLYDPKKKTFQGMLVPELKKVPDPSSPDFLDVGSQSFFRNQLYKTSDSDRPEAKKALPTPTTFDPALDDVDDKEFRLDDEFQLNVKAAAQQDLARLEALGNPVTVEDQIDHLLRPTREETKAATQRDEFNGFHQWAILKEIDRALEESGDTKRAHQLVDRWLRDVDLLDTWCKHDKVEKHMITKFGSNPLKTFSRTMAMAIGMRHKARVQIEEGDFGSALKSLNGCISLVHEGADLKKEEHTTHLGTVLFTRAFVSFQFKSYLNAETDLTRALTYLKGNRWVSVVQLRAECRERLGRLDEAREDEELAADMMDAAEVVTPILGEPEKWVV